MAQALGVSIYRDANITHLASGSFGVAEACSGLRSMGSLIVAALLLGYLELKRLPARVLVFTLATPIAIAFNVLRVTGTAVLANYNPDLAQGFYHLFSGWLAFLVGFGTLLAATRGIRILLERGAGGANARRAPPGGLQPPSRFCWRACRARGWRTGAGPSPWPAP